LSEILRLQSVSQGELFVAHLILLPLFQDVYPSGSLITAPTLSASYSPLILRDVRSRPGPFNGESPIHKRVTKDHGS
jgi:hypothetical protein